MSTTPINSNNKKSLEEIFASTDPVLKEMMSLFDSGDSAVAPPALNRMLSLRSSSRSVSASFISKVFASKDSLDMVFDSMDSLGFPPTGDAMCAKLNALDSEVPDIYQSREWIPDYENEHVDVDISPEVFKSTEKHSVAPKVASSWMAMYKEALGSAALPMPELMLPTPGLTPGVIYTPKTKPKSPKKKSTARKVFVKPTDMDVLCGRGGRSNTWKGNKRFRQVVDETKPIYNGCAKYEKTLLSQKVVDKMAKEGRRFLKPENGNWYVATNLDARRKAGQALREENTPESRAAKRERYR